MGIDYVTVRLQAEWLSAAMIPGDPSLGHPSARDVDLAGRLLPMVLNSRTDLAPPFLEVLARLPECEPTDPLGLLGRMTAEDRALVGRFIAGAYLADRQVMEAIGFPGFEALHSTTDYDEIIDAVEPIVARGPFYRGT